MSSVLISAFVSSSPNYDLLFDALSWPGDSWPELERINALTTFIEGLCPLLTEDHIPLPEPTTRCLVARVEAVVRTQCIPLLSRISHEFEEQRARETTAAVCRLLAACIPLCGADVSREAALCVLPALLPPQGDLEEEVLVQRGLNLHVAVEATAVLLPFISSDERLTETTLSSALARIKRQSAVAKVTVRILLTLVGCQTGASSGATLRFILDDLYRWHSVNGGAAATECALLCLTALSDHLLPHRPSLSLAPGRPDPRLDPQFWRIVQEGLTHRDNVSRKRALYLLKRCVVLSEDAGLELPGSASGEGGEILFRWAPERGKLLQEFWEDYALVLETLEENQVHVVRPVLNRIDMLIQTTADDSQLSDGRLFHPSWLLCVYQRMFHSENKSLMREGVCHLLELRALGQPAFSLAFSQFIVGPFMDVLSESSLFHRAVGQRIGECPQVAGKLKAFMVTFFSSLPSENRGSVLLQLIQKLGSKHWCAVPILFISQALSGLPTCPLLAAEGLEALREVLRSTMTTHQVLLRAAAQCHLLHTALHLTQVSAVTLDDVFSFLSHFRADESLCRGTQLWDRLCAWLSDNEGHFRPRGGDGADGPTTESVRSYVQHQLHAFLQVPASTGRAEGLPDPREADTLARAVLLGADMEARGSTETVPTRLDAWLSPLLDILSRLSTNVYLPAHKTDKSLQLTLRLLQLRGASSCQQASKERGDGVGDSLEKLLFAVVDPIQEFILRRLSGELQELCDVERAELYLSVLRQLTVTYSHVSQHRWKAQQTFLPKLFRNALKTLEEPAPQVSSVANQVTRALSMASVATICSLTMQGVIDSPSETTSALVSLNSYFYGPALSQAGPALSLPGPALSQRFNQTLQKPHAADNSSLPLQDWGRMAAHYLRDQWLCLSFLVGASETSWPHEALQGALSSCVEALTLLPSDLVLPVLTFMEAALPQVVLCEEDLCVQAVMLSWELVQGLSTNPHDFWPVLRGFVSMAFQRNLLELTDAQAPAFFATLKQIASELMELSSIKTGVFNVLIEHCSQTWLNHDSADCTFSSALAHMDILTEACVYGPVFRRDQRLIQEVQTYVEELGEECSANVVIPYDNRDDQFPRTCALVFLSHLDSSNPWHQRLMETLVTRLLKKDEEISKSKVRYYSNSLQHRVKSRVWQTVLLLLFKLREEFVTATLSRVFEAGFCSNQPSVKYLIEWTMVLILHQYPGCIARLWECFSVDQEKTKTSVCTFLSVLVHLNIILPKLNDKAVQWRKAVDVILQSCFNHNFSVRLYALLALKRVWALSEAKAEAEAAAGGAVGLGGLAAVVKACLHQAEAMQSTGNANKNWTRIQEHFFFGAFHPIRDYSVETIFYTFPSLSEVADDEWIAPWKFERLWGPSEGLSQGPTVPLRNPVPDLSQLVPGDWIQQDRGEQDKEERWAEVQKKMTPWRLSVQEQDPDLQLAPKQRATRLGKHHGALLVVASLIDKPTNLGGLCRTCEIFGGSGLVLDSLRHVSDKQFQALSVSSELWLPLLEVKPSELADFLQLKKSEGYCIVGVEQTANSQNLQDYRFP